MNYDFQMNSEVDINIMYNEYDPEIIQELHKTHAEMITDFHKLCSRHSIPYFAIGGTLLGAIRHKGFIPWDDDVDLGMLRKDYNRFINIAAEEYTDKYTICVPERENTYYNMIPKFILKDSKFVSAIAKSAGLFNMGIFLEIFVFEDIEPNKINQKIRQVNLTKLLHFEATSQHRIATGRGIVRIIKLLSKYCLYLFVKIFRFSPEKTNALYLKQTIGKKETGFVTCFGDHTAKDVISKKDDLFPILEVPFEEGTICIPHNWDTWLKQSYGNYREIPPKEKQKNHAAAILQFPSKNGSSQPTN